MNQNLHKVLNSFLDKQMSICLYVMYFLQYIEFQLIVKPDFYCSIFGFCENEIS